MECYCFETKKLIKITNKEDLPLDFYIMGMGEGENFFLVKKSFSFPPHHRSLSGTAHKKSAFFGVNYLKNLSFSAILYQMSNSERYYC